MPEIRTPLSPSVLSVVLENIVSSGSDDQCAVSIVSGARLIQDAILSGMDPHDFSEVLDSCPQRLYPVMTTVLDRAVSVFELEDGSSLSLWLLPVTLSGDAALPAVVPLETQSLNGLKTAAYLQAQLGLDAANGWVYILPNLVSAEYLHQTDIGALIRLPHQARAVVRGQTRSLKLPRNPEVGNSAPGVSSYFLPFVACHPAGTGISLPPASERTMHRVEKWVTTTLAGTLKKSADIEVHVAGYPQPFAEGMLQGERRVIDITLRETVMRVCTHTEVHPNGLAALVAPYITRQMEDEFVLGISLVSRLTGSFIATIPLRIGMRNMSDAQQQEEIVSLANGVLRDMGLQVIQLRHTPIDTIACQHCGNLQYAMPNLARDPLHAVGDTVQ